jgi:DNA-binding NarL/FixJ family response regulator
MDGRRVHGGGHNEQHSERVARSGGRSSAVIVRPRSVLVKRPDAVNGPIPGVSPNGELFRVRGSCFFDRMAERELMTWDGSTTGADATIRVLVADDHPAVRAGLVAVIAEQPDFTLVAQAENGARAVALYGEFRPDVALMDLCMPVMDGIEAIRRIVRTFPAARILAITTFEGDGDIRRALDAGARGYLLKDMLLTDVLGAIRAVHRGHRVIPPPGAARLAEATALNDLTDRELEVLRLVARGLSNREVARAIGRTNETVKIHLKNIFEKLGVAARTEAVTLALALGLLHLD